MDEKTTKFYNVNQIKKKYNELEHKHFYTGILQQKHNNFTKTF